MKKFITLLICSLICLSNSLNANEEKYILTIPTEIIASSNQSSLLGIDNNDNIVIGDLGQNQFAIWSNNKPLSYVNWDIRYLAFYGYKNGFAFGITMGGQTRNPFIWNEALGFQELQLRKSLPNIRADSSPAIVDANELGQIIGSYETQDGKTRVFIWENGKTRVLNIEDELILRGFHIINIRANYINSNGNIYGSFEYAKKHPLKNVWIEKKSNQFFWNGKIHILPKLIEASNVIGLNNDDEILFNSDLGLCAKRFDNEPRLLCAGYRGIAFNNRGQIIVQPLNSNDKTKSLSLFENGFYLNLSNIFDCYEIANLQRLRVNSNGVIAGEGSLWGERHVFKLIPTRN